jgi:hypothetical protein
MERNRMRAPGQKLNGTKAVQRRGRLDGRKRRRNSRPLFILFTTTLTLITGGFGALPDNPVTGLFRQEIAEVVPASYLEGFNSLLVSISEPPIEQIPSPLTDVAVAPSSANEEAVVPPTEVEVATEPPSPVQVPSVIPSPPNNTLVPPTAATPNPPTASPTIALLSPKNDTMLPPDGMITFSWSPVRGATNYRLEIILPFNQTVVFDTTETSRVQYIEVLAMGGQFQWRVTAFDGNGEIICSSDPFKFEKPKYIPPGQISNRSGGEEPVPVPSP